MSLGRCKPFRPAVAVCQIATGRGKLQVQPCPQCPVSDGRPEKAACRDGPLTEVARLARPHGEFKKSLGANALEHTKTPDVHQWQDSRQPEAGVLEERAIFRIRAFHASDVDQHL